MRGAAEVKALGAALALVAALGAGASAKDDKVVYIDGKTVEDVEILKETVEEVRIRDRGVKDLLSRDVLRLIHGSPPPSYAKGESALLAGQYSTAAEAFAKAENEAGEPWVRPYSIYHRAEALRLMGASDSDYGKLGEAVREYERFLDAFPEHFLYAPARYGLADAHLKAGDVQKARAAFEEVAQRRYGDYWELWGKLGKGLCALADKDYTDALTEFETTIANAKRPGFSELLARAQVAKGETYMAKGDYDRAITFYEELAARGEGQGAQSVAGAYVALAKAYVERGKPGDDRRALRMYMAVTIYYAGAPAAYAEALYQTGQLLEQQGKKKEAEAYYRELKARCPESSWADKVR